MGALLAACVASAIALSGGFLVGDSQPGGVRVIQPDVPDRSETTAPTLPSSPPATISLPDLRGPLQGVLRWVAPPASPTTAARTRPSGGAVGPYVACAPQPGCDGGPAPISSRRCPPALGALFDATFGIASPWAQSVAWRESNCQPAAHNREGASGLMQLMLPLHDDLFYAVGCTPAQWSDPSCAIGAAFLLYQGSGVAPWRL